MQLRVPTTVLLAMAVVGCAETGSPGSEAPQEPTVTSSAALTEAAPPFELNEAQVAGKVVYETMCWSCHGSAARGDGPAVRAGAVDAPRNLNEGSMTGATVRQLLADFQAQVGSLTPDNPHMANVLTIVDVEAFSQAIGYLPALTYPAELPGSAIAGHANYILRCQTCHGPEGRGDGPGAEVLELAPADFTQDTLLAARDFQAAFEKIRSGGGGVHASSMPAWGVMLEDGDVWDLVAYISSFQSGILSPPPANE